MVGSPILLGSIVLSKSPANVHIQTLHASTVQFGRLDAPSSTSFSVGYSTVWSEPTQASARVIVTSHNIVPAIDCFKKPGCSMRGAESGSSEAARTS